MEQPVVNLYELYLKCSGNRASTCMSKRRALKYFLRSLGGNHADLGLIKYAHAEDFRNYLTGKGNNPKTVNLRC